MLPYENRVVEHPRRFQVIKVPGTDDIFDFIPVPGTITNVGRAMNKEFFDSIDSDIKDRLEITNKATLIEAREGLNDTKYVTPLGVKEYSDNHNGIVYTGIELSTTENTTINLAEYMTENVKKVEIIINAYFDTNWTSFKLTGSVINTYGSAYRDSLSKSEVELGGVSHISQGVALLSIFPKANLYKYIGNVYSMSSASGAASGTGKLNLIESGSFVSLSTLTVGKKKANTSVNTYNFDNQIHIYQYVK